MRKIVGVTKLDKIKSQKIRKDLNVTSILEKIRWFNHIVRMKEDRAVKIIWKAKIKKADQEENRTKKLQNSKKGKAKLKQKNKQMEEINGDRSSRLHLR